MRISDWSSDVCSSDLRYLLAIMPLRMALTPKRTKARRVRRRALVYFQVGAERRTMGRTGILIYLSLDEHSAEIVADEAIALKVAPEVWGEAMAALIDHVRKAHPGKGMAEAVRQRSEERRVGERGVSTIRSGWLPYLINKKK